MTEPTLHRVRRAAISLHRSDMLVPVLGLSALALSSTALVAVAQVYPDLSLLSGALDQCNPLQGDFGCGHGFGCACHMLPAPGEVL